MKSLIAFLLISVMVSFRAEAQQQGLEKALGGLGLGGAKPEKEYTFKSSVTYKISTVDKRGKTQIVNTKTYFPDGEGYVGMKLLDASDVDVKKGMDNVDFMVFDIINTKIFTFINSNGKIYMGIAMRPDKFSETLEKENEKISITKTNETKTILGYECEGYTVKNDKDKANVIMWVSKKKIDSFAALSKKMESAFSGGVLGKQNNYYAYNAHPELAKIAKEGRAVLGYSSKYGKDESMEMELTDIKASDSYVFKASDYKSMF